MIKEQRYKCHQKFFISFRYVTKEKCFFLPFSKTGTMLLLKSTNKLFVFEFLYELTYVWYSVLGIDCVIKLVFGLIKCTTVDISTLIKLFSRVNADQEPLKDQSSFDIKTETFYNLLDITRIKDQRSLYKPIDVLKTNFLMDKASWVDWPCQHFCTIYYTSLYPNFNKIKTELKEIWFAVQKKSNFFIFRTTLLERTKSIQE